jgi:hypothetical protein
MSKVKIRNLTMKNTRGYIKKLCKKYWHNELFPPPPTPTHKVTHFKIDVDYIGRVILVRFAVDTKLTVFREILEFKFNQYDEIIPTIDSIINSKCYYNEHYKKEYII